MLRILDPKFHYINSVETDVGKTFARVRREMRQRDQQIQAAAVAETATKVLRMAPRRAVALGGEARL